jgi:hypothetical protein
MKLIVVSLLIGLLTATSVQSSVSNRGTVGMEVTADNTNDVATSTTEPTNSATSSTSSTDKKVEASTETEPTTSDKADEDNINGDDSGSNNEDDIIIGVGADEVSGSVIGEDASSIDADSGLDYVEIGNTRYYEGTVIYAVSEFAEEHPVVTAVATTGAATATASGSGIALRKLIVLLVKRRK